jgi:hypothetical protein
MNRIEMVIDQTEWFKPMIAHQTRGIKNGATTGSKQPYPTVK